MKKWICLLLCCLCLLSGCTVDGKAYVPTGDALVLDDGSVMGSQETEPEKEQELVLMYYPEVSMNPFTCTDFTNRTLFSLIYQSLFSVSADFEPVPILCENYRVSSDYKIYTVYIHDATFSDGTPVTVEDALAGASDIIAEDLSDDPAIRKSLRELIHRRAVLVSKAVDTVPFIGNPTLEEILEADRLARAAVKSFH